MNLLTRLWSKTPRLLVLGLIVLLSQLWLVSSAKAATTCSATATNMAFGNVASAGNTDSDATITVTCTTNALFVASYVSACLDIGIGSGGSSAGRRMLNGYSDGLAFEFYEDGSRSRAWGGSAYMPPAYQAQFAYGVYFGGSYTRTFTLYGRIPAQSGLASGNYQSTFSAGHARLSYRYNEVSLFTGGGTYPASCTAGGDGGGTSGSFPFTATANVPDRCELGIASDLDFGNVPGLIASNRDQSSSISLTCTRRTPWQLGLNDGLHANGTQRRMRSGSGQFVRYELYRNAARSQRWGRTLNLDTELGTGSGTAQSITVYGRVPAPQSVPAGSYSDTIVVTVTY